MSTYKQKEPEKLILAAAFVAASGIALLLLSGPTAWALAIGCWLIAFDVLS